MHDKETLEKLTKRFFKKVKFQPGDCWIWQGGSTPKGYGTFNGGELTKDKKGNYFYKKITAHRFAYQLEYGEIPSGYVVDHLCRMPPCVHPLHLEAVTHQENLKRGIPNGRKGKKLNREEEKTIKEEYSGKFGEIAKLARKHEVSPSSIRKTLNIITKIGSYGESRGRPIGTKKEGYHRHKGGAPACMRWHPITKKHHNRL